MEAVRGRFFLIFICIISILQGKNSFKSRWLHLLKLFKSFYIITLNITVSLLYFSILQFPHFLFLLFLFFFSGQEEIRYPNGTLQISFADGSVKRIDTDGTENINFPDGTKGQLISKCPFGVFKSTKKQRNFCKDFCPSL